MAATHDATTLHSGSASFTHTPSGTPTGVIVFMKKGGGGSVSGVTYGGVAMTQAAVDDDGNQEAHVWTLSASIPTGAQTVSIAGTGAVTIRYVACVTVTGSSGFSDAQAVNSTTGAVSSVPTLTVTSAAGDLVVNFAEVGVFPAADLSMSAGADQTETAEGYGGDEENVAVSWQAGAASVAMDYSWGTTTNIQDYAHCAVNIVQAVAATGPTIPISALQWWTPVTSRRRRRRRAA